MLKVEYGQSGLQVKASWGSGDHLNVTLSVPGNGKVQITLSDMSGRVITSQQKFLQAGQYSMALAAGNAKPGVYVVTVNDEREKKVIKVLK